MAGSKLGGQKAAMANYKRYGKDFYRDIGRKGGRNGTTGGFAWMKANGQVDKVRAAGSKGGHLSRRRPVKLKEL